MDNKMANKQSCHQNNGYDTMTFRQMALLIQDLGDVAIPAPC